MKRLLPVLMGFVVLLLSSTEGWSLPPCEGSPTSNLNIVRYWTDCVGTYTAPDSVNWKGDKYVGEFKDGKPNGHGTYTWSKRNKYVNKYVGEFKDGLKHGQGTLTFRDGRAKQEGIFKNNKFRYAKKTPSKVTAKKTPLDKAKEQCVEIGFTKGTEKFGDCVMKLMD
jgi:hypothetical protein